MIKMELLDWPKSLFSSQEINVVYNQKKIIFSSHKSYQFFFHVSATHYTFVVLCYTLCW